MPEANNQENPVSEMTFWEHLEELRRRLVNRATDAPAEIERRLHEARRELAQCRGYDYLVVNDDFDKAAADLRGIVVAARSRASRKGHLVDVLEEGG